MRAIHSSFAMVFPGQGSQSVGMLAELAAIHPIILETFAQASDLLNYDLWALAQQGPASKLDQTRFTQPVMLASDWALWRCWINLGGGQPAVVAGHSLGEYVALVCAESLNFDEAIKLVALRGKLMQEALLEGEGAMAAIIGLSDEIVTKLCVQAQEQGIVSPANFNAIGQVVISGQLRAVLLAMDLAKQAGAKIVKRLAVSVPSHCALMQSAKEPFKKALNQISINMPTIPIVYNVNARSEVNDTEYIKTLLIEQLVKPVRWVETIQLIHKDFAPTTIYECGPGRVLTGLNKRINKDRRSVSLHTHDILEKEVKLCH